MASAFDPPGQEPGALQHTEMFRCCRLGNPEWLAQLPRRAFAALGQHDQHRPPGAVPKGVEREIEVVGIMYCHLAIYYWEGGVRSSQDRRSSGTDERLTADTHARRES